MVKKINLLLFVSIYVLSICTIKYPINTKKGKKRKSISRSSESYRNGTKGEGASRYHLIAYSLYRNEMVDN